MRETTKRGIWEGLGYGVVAGVIFGVAEVIGAAIRGEPPLGPIRMFASIVLGKSALTATAMPTVIGIGGLAHLVLSAVFGVIYGAINGVLSTRTETSYARQTGLGVLFGIALWLVNFQLVARALYPWFLGASQGVQVVMHAVFFGLPLALMYATAERRAQHIGRHVRVLA